ncbi:MAG: DNA methyltransferase [Candidatus Hodarchaeota archaeon]
MSLSDKDIEWIAKLAIPERDKGYTRTFFSYPAKFQAKLPRGIIKKYSSEKEFVFDPFVGGGTTGLESMLLNRRFSGYDINPFAIFLSKVKTTFIEPSLLLDTLANILESNINFPIYKDLLDDDDKLCLGKQISHEINMIFNSIRQNSGIENVQWFFELALIHSTKIVGRRDFELRNNWKNASIIPIFQRKSKKMIRGISTLPRNIQFRPEFKIASSNKIDLENDSVNLIITSPPYKGLDVEYQQLQLQRRSIQRSKRSNIISTILGTTPIQKKRLCWTGRSGQVYWENCLKSLKECYRILKNDKLAFFWVGFKSLEDKFKFKTQLERAGFHICNILNVSLSNDRAASGRSTHHGRATGMMSNDYLFIAKKKKES